MRVVLTGSSGRVGRAIFATLAGTQDVVGVDRSPFSTTAIVGDIGNPALLRQVMRGADAVIHTAALHAPHVGTVPDEEFLRVNVEATRLVAEIARELGIRRLIFTSTTALYGHAVAPGRCTWIDETTAPQPRTVYHRTKLAAEEILEAMAGPDLALRVLRMSRSFPEAANVMAAYRLHRGVDIRDVADAHVAALANGGPYFQRHIVTASTPFLPSDCEMLASAPGPVLRERAPDLVQAFQLRGWPLPKTVDRIYASATSGLGWQPRFGPAEVLAQLDRRSLEVLPAFVPPGNSTE